jgi:hypothetical protein
LANQGKGLLYWKHLNNGMLDIEEGGRRRGGKEWEEGEGVINEPKTQGKKVRKKKKKRRGTCRIHIG